jgi:heme-degrading monooxygenase HmoA
MQRGKEDIMIMRITWGKLRPGTWNEFEQTYHDKVAGKKLKGLQGRWLAQDVNDPDGGFSVSLWDTQENLQAYEQSEFFQQEIIQSLRPFFGGTSTTYHCDVKHTQ